LVSGHGQKHFENPKRMKMEYIKNREGRIIGIVSGEWLMDGHSKLVARYIRSNDITVTREGRVIGKGDQRLRTLPAAK
jgi:hypothetical protein